MSKKTNSVSLFGTPVPYGTKPVAKTDLLVLESDDSGKSVVKIQSVEDFMCKQIELNFNEVSLSNLVAKGVEPHALDMIDSSKLGVDAGIEQLANTLISDSFKYVEPI